MVASDREPDREVDSDDGTPTVARGGREDVHPGAASPDGSAGTSTPGGGPLVDLGLRRGDRAHDGPATRPPRLSFEDLSADFTDDQRAEFERQLEQLCAEKQVHHLAAAPQMEIPQFERPSPA